MEASQVEDDFIGRMESTIDLLVNVTEELLIEDTDEFEEFDVNLSLQEGMRGIYAARFALRNCIELYKARRVEGMTSHPEK